MAIAISLFVVFLALFVVLVVARKNTSPRKGRRAGDASLTMAAGSDTGGSRKGHGDNDGHDSGDGGGDGGGGGD